MRPRPIAAVLASCLLLSSTGCITAERRANQHLNRIGVGMTRDEVMEVLGGPDSLTVGAGRESWHYSYGSRPDPAKIATYTGQMLAVLTVFGAFLALMAYGNSPSIGNGPTLLDGLGPRGDGSTDSETVHFRVVFDWTRRVVEISGIEPCDEE